MQQRHSMPLATAIRGILALAVIGAGAFSSPPAQAGVDVQVNIGNAPPPPRFDFESRPHEQYYRSEGVYVVDDPRVGDNDFFRYGNNYWMFNDGYWYRSASWRGPFAVVYPRYVPAVFYRMPPSRWKHRPNGPPRYVQTSGRPGHRQEGHMPPGQRKHEDKGKDKGNGGGGHGH